ncbi:MAG: RecX family transcriptional regulator [Clostridia bacterium]|nr:RecX family transcriptional regulator [Clostridia bacterium]
MENKIYYKIEKIKKTPQGYIFYITSSLGTSFEMPVSPDQYDRFDLEEGEIIDDAHFLKIREEHLFDNARRHAFSILSYGENNKKMLATKLQRQGFSRELSENVALYMEHRGYIDEKKQMGLLIDTYLKKKFGRIKIVEELILKGYRRDEVSEYVKSALTEINFAENCAWIIEHKYNPLPKDPNEIKKMMTALMRYGYNIGDIKEAIRIFQEGQA